MLSDAEFWQQLSRWFAGIVASLSAILLAFVKWWVGDRFRKVDARIDSVEKDVKNLNNKNAAHDKQLGEITAHMEHFKEQSDRTLDSIRRLHDKFDNHIANRN